MQSPSLPIRRSLRRSLRRSRRSSRLLQSLPILSLALTALITSSAQADIYRWVDARGQIHFTDDPGRVPVASRTQVARVDVGSRDRGWNYVQQNSGSLEATRGAATFSPRRHVVSVAKAGLEWRVHALLNGSEEAPFVMDTGAMINMIPLSVIDSMGIRIDENTPRIMVSGITAEPQLVPVITLREIEVGGAVVEEVEMAVLESLPVGLLGMPFFNHFRVETDPVRGTLTLEELDSESAALVRSRSRIVGQSDPSYQLSWGAVEGAVRYHLTIAADSDFQELVDETWINETNADLETLGTGALRAGTYFWRVSAVDADGTEGPSSESRHFVYRASVQ